MRMEEAQALIAAKIKAAEELAKEAKDLAVAHGVLVKHSFEIDSAVDVEDDEDEWESSDWDDSGCTY